MSQILSSLLEHWGSALSQVLRSMTDQKAETTWQIGPAPETEPEILWWEQPLQLSPEMTIWIAAPRTSWEHSGTITLKAAGLDTVELIEARNTYIEILGQSLSSLARSIGAMLGREVACAPGEERAPSAVPESGGTLSLTFGDTPARTLWIGFSPKLIAVLSLPPEERRSEDRSAAERAVSAAGEADGNPATPPTMDLLLEVELPVSISFGKTELPMKDVLKLTTGSIVELNRSVSEPVEVLVNHCLIARGEVVVVEGNYGVRIQHIASRQDRMRSLR
jgi:flagellar motor switch protein FliN/FliY